MKHASYEEQHVGLGDEFLNELEIAYRKIANNPHHYGFIDENKILRDYLIRRFPYLIVYRIKDDTIEILLFIMLVNILQKNTVGANSTL